MLQLTEGSSAVVEDLQNQLSRSHQAVAYFYVDIYEAVPETRLIAVLLRQLLEQSSSIPESVIGQYDSQRGRTLHYKTLEMMLSRVLSLFEKTYICIDGLDELAEDQLQHFGKLFYLLKSLGASVIVFSRRTAQVERYLKDDAIQAFIDNFEVGDDIQLFVRSQISGSRRLQGRTDLQDAIFNKITKQADGI